MILVLLFTSLFAKPRDARTNIVIPAIAGNLDDQIAKEDLLVLINNQVELFLNTIEPESDSDDFLSALDYTRDRNEYEINIREIIDNISIGANPLLDNLEGRSPDLAIDLSSTVENGDIIPVRLNADLLDDVFVFTEHDSSQVQGILLLSK